MKPKIPLTEKKYALVFTFLTFLFLMWGLALTMGDVLNKQFQDVLHISKSRSGLIQLSTFGAYAVMSIPAGLFIKKYGYKRGVILGLILYATGAYLFIPAADAQSFEMFRFALFILACGMATLETVAHPFIALLGNQETSDQRLNFAQSFNGLGGIIGPVLGGYFILNKDHDYSRSLLSVKYLYLYIGLFMTLITVAFSFIKIPSLNPLPQKLPKNATHKTNFWRDTVTLFSKKHFAFAVVAQFFNVAAQGGTWAYFINYGHEVVHLSPEKASYFFGFSIFMLMIGRFAGTFAMRYFAPSKLLTAFAASNILMCLLVAQGLGWISFVALIMINFFFSIMFPTIFSLGLKDLGPYTPQASPFIVMGLVGGALFPPLMGLVANHNIAHAYYFPIICYLIIATFGFLYPKLRGLYNSPQTINT